MSRPLLSARPLLDSDADAELFVPFGATFADLVAAADRGYSVLVHGPRGSGRTTLLRALLRQRRLAGAPTPTVFVQAAATEGPAAVLQACRTALLDVLHGATPSDGTANPGSVTTELAELRSVVTGTRATFLLDNLDPHTAHRLFGLGRDDLWELDASFIVTATDDDVPIVLAPPADAFFEVRIAIPAPTAAEASALLTRRLGRPVEAPASPTTPRALVDAARTDPEDPGSAHAEHRRRLDRAAELGAPALAVARLLEEFGTVGPSDEIVRDRLGLTAARISQILGQMYDEDLVTFEDVHRGGPGRPRRQYRWASEGPPGGGTDDRQPGTEERGLS